MTAFAIDANLAFDNYDELISAINDWMDRNDLSGVAPQMIVMAEDEIRLALEPVFLETSTSLMSDSTGYAALPSDVKRVTRVTFGNAVLRNWGVEAPDYENEGSTPNGYTIESGGLRLWPNGVYTVSALYQTKLPRLSNANPTSLLLDDFPSLYFFGAMTYAHGYVEDDDRAARFRALFDNMLARVAEYYRKQRYSGPLVAKVPNIP